MPGFYDSFDVAVVGGGHAVIISPIPALSSVFFPLTCKLIKFNPPVMKSEFNFA